MKENNIAIYDYQCSHCNAVFEQTKKILDRDDTSLDVCPECSTTGHVGRMVCSPTIGYSVATKAYGRGAGDGWKDVLKKIHKRSPGSQMDKTSSFM